MADVIPFKGLRYNPKAIKNLADVVTPPFDVISAQAQQYLYNRHPQNIVRLVLGKTFENDSGQNNRYSRAADYLNQWRSENILMQDDSPSFYLTAVSFTHETKTVTRYGLIALVKLEPYEKGVILPHEKTFSKIKLDRLDLTKACRMNFSPIFSLYSDGSGDLEALQTEVCQQEAAAELVDPDGRRHRLWRVTDVRVHRAITHFMKNKQLFIADGHHRYETALGFKAWTASIAPQMRTDHPADYVMMYLSSMQDPGLVILPAHRMFAGIPAAQRKKFIPKAKDFFEIVEIPFDQGDRQKASAGLKANLKTDPSENTIGVCIKGASGLYVLTPKPAIMERLFGDELPGALRSIDVTVLTRLILMQILEFDQNRLDDEKRVGYTSSDDQAIEAITTEKYDIAFILNPTKIEQVRRVAEEGLIMPRKSTYFYPKVLTGQVMYQLDD